MTNLQAELARFEAELAETTATVRLYALSHTGRVPTLLHNLTGCNLRLAYFRCQALSSDTAKLPKVPYCRLIQLHPLGCKYTIALQAELLLPCPSGILNSV